MKLKLKNCIIGFLASAFQAFGIYHIHAQSPLTEGGIFGLTLLLNHHFGISPAISGAVLTAVCYLLGLRILGKSFLIYSAMCAGGFSIGYALFEQFPPLWPGIGSHPLIGAIVGAFFIGLGSGICVRCGGATTGDDALAMALSHRWHTDIRNIYLVSDLAVLLLSLTFIPLGQITYSLLTVILSGQLISLVQKAPCTKLFFMVSWKKEGEIL